MNTSLQISNFGRFFLCNLFSLKDIEDHQGVGSKIKLQGLKK